MKFSMPAKSIRLRLQIWYAIVLLVVIGGFAGALYFQVRGNRLRAIDERLRSAATYLAATLAGLPPHELEEPPGRGPGDPDRFRRPPPEERERAGDFPGPRPD